MWWEEAIGRNMDLPDGYDKVAVLIIKWADELDELKTAAEAKELEMLFQDRFHYLTRTVELNMRNKPHHQLDSHMSEFIRDHDGPHNLLIIYYTGHGVFREDTRVLELTATINPAAGKGFFKDARCNWNKVEQKLKDDEVEGDVLTILDTCYASNFVKSGKEESRKFELLSACPIDQTTASPGTHSFTRALIDTLQKLHNEYGERPFSTFRLVQLINIDSRRADTPAHLWSREHNEQHILLAPLKPDHRAGSGGRAVYRPSPKGFLVLRFGLRDVSLNKEQIEFMTKTLARAFNNKAMVGLRRVEWLDIKPAPPITHFERVALVMFVMTKWKGLVSSRREERESQRLLEEAAFPESMDLDSTASSQKRRHEGIDESPEAKRRFLDASQAPSPPISDSSRVGYDL
ncbi:hypothetical protein IQ07DRAFT_518450 [Pyrenochaeta sp. DS3sAY3a]|nr:hypothetical protein IQ07DRAFT_518450 [Pyrenochaeta sp. DS3sAY3a]